MPPVVANEGRLGQVFLNLLVNAAQAVPEGDTTAHEIRVVLKRVGNEVVAEVCDTGVGIKAEHLARLFDPFFTTKPVGHGTGLGLDIVRRLLLHNDAQIEVESRPGRTEFRVSLPIDERDETGGKQ